MSEIADLPPLLGFDEEELVITPIGGFCTDFYTCIHDSKRVFVWSGFNNWLIQIEDKCKSAEKTILQRFQNCDEMHFRVPMIDPLALKAVIIELAKGPSE